MADGKLTGGTMTHVVDQLYARESYASRCRVLCGSYVAVERVLLPHDASTATCPICAAKGAALETEHMLRGPFSAAGHK